MDVVSDLLAPGLGSSACCNPRQACVYRGPGVAPVAVARAAAFRANYVGLPKPIIHQGVIAVRML